MNETKELAETIIEGIQEKKGKGIVLADLRTIHNTICQYLVICQGNSPSHVSAITDEVREYVRKKTGEKPSAIDGQQVGEWVAMDYSDIIVHVFLPEAREHYDLEHLWEDAKLEKRVDID